jgi:hypothetical protein
MHRRHLRSGLHIRGQRGHPHVRAALVRYARWLRLQFDFPIFVPVYLQSSATVRTMHGVECSASIFLPWKRDEEPYIRIATGDYPQLRRERGRDNALAAFIGSLTHEILHYRQWIDTGDSSERGVAVKASGVVRRYAQSVATP